MRICFFAQRDSVNSLAILNHSGHLSSAYTGIFIFIRSRISQLITLHFDSKPISVLCHMGDFGCGHGGWTPVMKIDGSKVLSNSIKRKTFIWRSMLSVHCEEDL